METCDQRYQKQGKMGFKITKQSCDYISHDKHGNM